jgi:hypothetical protein
MAAHDALTVIHATGLSAQPRVSWTSGLYRGEHAGDEQQQKSDSRHGTSFSEMLLGSILRNPQSLYIHIVYT